MPEYRSVSQYNEYKQCPHRYYLHRVEREWEKPAAWLPMGLGVHEAAEAWEKSERTLPLEAVEDVYRESYAKHTNRLCEDTPNFSFWFWSGPYNGEKDIKRRYGLGLEQVGRYVDYYTDQAPEEKPWVTPDGEMAVELPFEIDLDGVAVRGYIDNVIEKPKSLVVRDNKTGRSPGDDFQLGVYGVAVKKKYDKTVSAGDYWMGRNGKPTVPYKLDYWTVERVTEEFHKLDEAVRAERFEPDPSPEKCRFCPVSAACDFAEY